MWYSTLCVKNMSPPFHGTTKMFQFICRRWPFSRLLNQRRRYSGFIDGGSRKWWTHFLAGTFLQTHWLAIVCGVRWFWTTVKSKRIGVIGMKNCCALSQASAQDANWIGVMAFFANRIECTWIDQNYDFSQVVSPSVVSSWTAIE